MNRALLGLPVLLAALAAGPAQADRTGKVLTGDNSAAGSTMEVAQATIEEWIEVLKDPVDPAQLRSRERVTRGLTIEADDPPPAAGVNFKVQFAFGSAELTDEARASLDQLGLALKSDQLQPYRFRIAGHTDAVGEIRFNQTLSERRARAVRNYLTSAYGISRERLESVGLGERMLLIPNDPAADANRRVEIMNIGG